MNKLPIAPWRKVLSSVVVFLTLVAGALVFGYAELNCSVGPGDDVYWACREGSTYWPDAARVAGVLVLIGIAFVALLLRRPLESPRDSGETPSGMSDERSAEQSSG